MSATSLKKVRPSTMHQQVIDQIREAIIRGELAPGSHLSELALGERMSVSRAPIREALRQLELEGLVYSVPNRGCFVVDFNEQDIAEVFSLRANLECMALALVGPHLSRADLAVLRRQINEHEKAIQEGRLDELTDLDMQFHEYIMQKAGHRRLLKTWREQVSQCKLLLNRRFHVLAQTTPDTVVRDHLDILDWLERNDTAGAIALTQSISERVTAECIQIARMNRSETSAA